MKRPFDREQVARRLEARLTQLRNVRGWSQRELSRRTGLDPTRLSRLERGIRLPKLEELVAFREVFAIGLEELAFGESAEAQEVLELARRLLEVASREEEAGLRKLFRLLLTGLQHGDPAQETSLRRT